MAGDRAYDAREQQAPDTGNRKRHDETNDDSKRNVKAMLESDHAILCQIRGDRRRLSLAQQPADVRVPDALPNIVGILRRVGMGMVADMVRPPLERRPLPCGGADGQIERLEPRPAGIGAVGEQSVISGGDRQPAGNEVRNRKGDLATGYPEMPGIERPCQGKAGRRQQEQRRRPTDGAGCGLRWAFQDGPPFRSKRRAAAARRQLRVGPSPSCIPRQALER